MLITSSQFYILKNTRGSIKIDKQTPYKVHNGRKKSLPFLDIKLQKKN